MKPSTSALLAAIAVLLFASGLAASYPYTGWQKGPWEKEGTDDGITIYSNSDAPGDNKAYRADAVLDAPPSKVFPLVISHERARSWSFMADYRVIKEKGNRAVVYQKVDQSGLDPRDYTIRSFHFKPAKENQGTYGFVWEEANKAGPPSNDDAVRVEHVAGSLILTPVDGGKKTRVSYRFLMDPGTWVPAFIVNSALEDSAVEVIERLREDLKK